MATDRTTDNEDEAGRNELAECFMACFFASLHLGLVIQYRNRSKDDDEEPEEDKQSISLYTLG